MICINQRWIPSQKGARYMQTHRKPTDVVAVVQSSQSPNKGTAQ